MQLKKLLEIHYLDTGNYMELNLQLHMKIKYKI